MVDKLQQLWRSGLIALVAGVVSGAATIAVNDFKVTDLSSQFRGHVQASNYRQERIEDRVRSLEIETAADIREIKTILERMERGIK